MSSPRAGVALRPGLARRGWLNTMMGSPSGRQEETGSVSSIRKSAYMGEEEV
jgi:hypothetical protein